jgi:hypothetical protein
VEGVDNMSNRGMYATACEQSEHKNKIDKWLNEGKSFSFISKQLETLGDKISDKSIGKYAKYRDTHIQGELLKDPVYQAQVAQANATLVEEVGKIKQVNVLNHIAETIEHCAELVQGAKLDDIRVKTVQDLRYVQMTMLESLKLYGDTMLKAQQMQKIEDDPSLIKPTVNLNVKNVLVDMLGGVDDAIRFKLIDGIRASLGGDVKGGVPRNTSED